VAPGSVPIAGSVDRNHMINASAETITEKPSYRRLVESKFILFPQMISTNGAEKETARFPSAFT
jgi:hypothetical protein